MGREAPIRPTAGGSSTPVPRHFSNAEILNAVWAWGGRVDPAVKSLHMNRGQCYERLKALGVGPEQRRELAETGRVALGDGTIYEVPPDTGRCVLPDVSGASGRVEAVWSVRSVDGRPVCPVGGEASGVSGLSGGVSGVRSVQQKEVVRVISGGAVPTFGSQEEQVSAVHDAPVTVLKKAWIAKPGREATLRFEKAVLDLAEEGKDTSRDALLETFILSDHFTAFVAELKAAYRRLRQAATESQ